MNGSEYVKHRYQIEEHMEDNVAYREASSMNFSLRMPAEQLALFDALAQRFGESRNSLASEILGRFAKDAFAELCKADRRKVAEKADDFGKAYFDKLGITGYDRTHQHNADAFDKWDELKAAEEDKAA